MKRVAIVMGGDSAEYDISLKSAQVVFQHLDRTQFEPHLVSIRGKDWTCEIDGNLYRINKHDFSIQTIQHKLTFDGVFIAIHGTPGENGLLQAYFDLIGLPYSTAGQLQLALTFDKAMCNAVLAQRGFDCGQALVFDKGDAISKDVVSNTIGYPCFVKPTEAGSSFGVSKVHSEAELDKAIAYAFEHHHRIMIESFLEGREVTCAVHNFKGELEALPLTEIITSHDFFDYEAKYEGASQEITPAELDEVTTQRVQDVSKQIYKALGMDGVFRVDFMLNPNGTPYVIEVNTVPGLSEASLVPQMAHAAGYTLADFFTQWTKHLFR
jgi:D-alanine-D-alanine ligase